MAPKSSTTDDHDKKIKQVLGEIGKNIAELAYLILQNTPNALGIGELQQSLASTPSSDIPKKKRKRFPDEPVPPRSSFFHYMEDARKTADNEYKHNAIAQSKQFGEQWQKLSDKEKKIYMEKAVKDRERYDKEIEEYVKKHPDRAEFLTETKKLRSKQMRDATSATADSLESANSKKNKARSPSPSPVKTEINSEELELAVQKNKANDDAKRKPEVVPKKRAKGPSDASLESTKDDTILIESSESSESSEEEEDAEDSEEDGLDSTSDEDDSEDDSDDTTDDSSEEDSN